MSEMSRRSLRAMKARWEQDLARLEGAYPVSDWEAGDDEVEVQRNLGTAIVWMDGLITKIRPTDN